MQSEGEKDLKVSSAPTHCCSPRAGTNPLHCIDSSHVCVCLCECVCACWPQISATKDSVNRHERHAVGDLFKFNKERWIVGRCIVVFFFVFPAILLRVCLTCVWVYTCVCVCVCVCVCLCVHAAHHRLFGNVHQVFNVVVLVLLKGREEHVQHDLPLGPHHLPLGLLLLLMQHLRIKWKITTTTTTNINTNTNDNNTKDCSWSSVTSYQI